MHDSRQIFLINSHSRHFLIFLNYLPVSFPLSLKLCCCTIHLRNYLNLEVQNILIYFVGFSTFSVQILSYAHCKYFNIHYYMVYSSPSLYIRVKFPFSIRSKFVLKFRSVLSLASSFFATISRSVEHEIEITFNGFYFNFNFSYYSSHIIWCLF